MDKENAAIDLDLGKIRNLLEWQVKCRDRTPLAHVRDDDAHMQEFLRVETNRWNNRDDDAFCTPAATESFMMQLLDCLANIESRDRITIMKRIQTLGGYGYYGGGVSGRNEYSKDKSRVDGALIQRARR